MNRQATGVSSLFNRRRSIVRHRTSFRRRLAQLSAIALLSFLVFAPVALAADDGGIVPDNNVGRYSFLIGTFLPVAISAVNRQKWTAQAKGVGAFAVSAIAAAGTSFFAGDLGTENLITSLLIILVMATLTYQTFWKPTGISPGIESVTG